MSDWIGKPLFGADSHPAIASILAGGLALGALVCFLRGGHLMRLGLANPDHPSQSFWVVRGMRSGIVAIGLLFLAGGIYFNVRWPLLFGAVFIGEELLETGIMLLALRSSDRASGSGETDGGRDK